MYNPQIHWILKFSLDNVGSCQCVYGAETLAAWNGTQLLVPLDSTKCQDLRNRGGGVIHKGGGALWAQELTNCKSLG